MHADMTAVTIQSNKIVLNEVTDSRQQNSNLAAAAAAAESSNGER